MTSRLSPQKYLRLIGEAGFTHLHWCHQWNTDYLYSTYEIAQYKKWLQEYGLKLLGIHGSMGQEKMWFSFDEYQRKSGVLLVLNRIILLIGKRKIKSCGQRELKSGVWRRRDQSRI